MDSLKSKINSLKSKVSFEKHLNNAIDKDNYESKIEKLKIGWNLQAEKFAAEAQRLNHEAIYLCNQFNSQITIINVERHLMRNEITKLYKFLRCFGNIGEKLTPFDFVAEEWLFPVTYSQRDISKTSSFSNEKFNIQPQNPFMKFCDTGLDMFNTMPNSQKLGVSTLMGTAASAIRVGVMTPLYTPVLLPAYMIYSRIKKDQELKDFLIKMELDRNNDLIRRENEINKQQAEVTFMVNAIQIANMYRGMVAIIRDTIAEKILPEINGVLAFLYADAIKNSIISNEDPSTAKISNILEFRGTPYEMHYKFIKNTFDYYTLVSKFFAEPILTNLLQDRKLTETEMNSFKKQVDEIEKQRQMLIETSRVGG